MHGIFGMIFPACSLEKTEIFINMADSDLGLKGRAVLKPVIRQTERSRLCHLRKHNSEGIQDAVEYDKMKLYHEIASFQGLKIESCNRNYFGAFAAEVTTATPQLSVFVDEICARERVAGSQLSNMSR